MTEIRAVTPVLRPAPYVSKPPAPLDTFQRSQDTGIRQLALQPRPRTSPDPGRIYLAGPGTTAHLPPGLNGDGFQGVNANGTYRMDIPSMDGQYLVKLEDWTGFKTRPYIESLVYHIDALLPTAPDGTSGTLVPRTSIAVPVTDIPAPAGHPNQEPVKAGLPMSAQAFVADAVNLRDVASAEVNGPRGYHPDFVRLNFLDHLVGNVDRHRDNILWHRGAVYAIDNGQAGIIGSADNMNPFDSERKLMYGEYPVRKRWSSGLTDRAVMLQFLKDSRAYAEQALPCVDDESVGRLIASHKQMVSGPAFNPPLPGTSTPSTLGVRLGRDLDTTYYSIRTNRDMILYCIDEHIRALQSGENPPTTPTEEATNRG